ncbi:MAG: ABC transporter permease [Bacteroidota bacterium]
MFQNYLKIALRNLVRNKVYSFINIAGLAMGIAAFLLILEYVSLEKSVNQFHENLPNMYRMLCQNAQGESWPQVEPGWAIKAKERFPEVKDFCRFEDGIANGVVTNQAKNISFREQKIGYVEGNFFQFFSFHLQKGSAKSLNKPDVVFISEASNKKYFNGENSIGKTLTINNQFGKHLYTIEGIYDNMGENSDIQMDMVLSLETLKNPANLNDNGWANLNNLDSQYINMFFLLNDGVDYKAFEKKMTNLRRELQREKDATTFQIQPVSEVHLASSFSDTLQHTGNVRYVYMLMGISFLILLIAWFNYINLSTANAIKRANEVGVRKVVGASQSNLIGQFLGESLLVNLLALGLGLVLISLLQPLFNQIIGKELSLLTLGNSPIWLIGVSLLVSGSLASGAYTAYTLSNFKPIETLKGKVGKTAKGVLLRKILVVSQFCISIALILFTLLLYRQLKFMQGQDLGMNINQLLVIQGPQIGKDSTYKTRRNAFTNALVQQSFVKDYCISGSVPSRYYNFATEGFTSPKSKTGDENKAYSFVMIGDRYLKTYGIKLEAGRNFTSAECAVEWNDNSKILLNERAIRSLGFTSAEEVINTKVKWDERYLEVIGVVKDYNHQSLQTAVLPMIFYPQNNSSYFTVRLSGGKMQDKVASLENLYKKYFSGNPFEYFFADESYNKQYLKEQQYASLFTTASLWAIFIACLGLFGLATFTVESRTKEIGIRKVLGASVSSITALLSKDFLTLVLISIVIASPIAYYFMDKWLQDFAYRINIEWWIFVVAGVLSIVISLLTISYQSIRAAMANPVKSLKTE